MMYNHRTANGDLRPGDIVEWRGEDDLGAALFVVREVLPLARTLRLSDFPAGGDYTVPFDNVQATDMRVVRSRRAGTGYAMVPREASHGA